MKKLFILSAAMLALTLVTPASTYAYSTSTIREAQNIMRKYGLPTGTADGIEGPMTRRGLCIFRYMSGMKVTRTNLDSATLSKLRSYNKSYSSITKIPTKYTSSAWEKIVAHETCQAMTFSRRVSSNTTKHRFWKVVAISTGINAHECKNGAGKTVTCNTPNGTYRLNNTLPGWTCSTIYPETCRRQTTGDNIRYGNYGNMYNFRKFYYGYGIHGSTSVPTYPASHGCIRVSVKDSDWMYRNVGNGSIVPSLTVTGAY